MNPRPNLGRVVYVRNVEWNGSVWDDLADFKAEATKQTWSETEVNQVIDYALAGIETAVDNDPDLKSQIRSRLFTFYQPGLFLDAFPVPELRICGGCGQVTSRALCHSCTNPKV